MRTSAYNPDKVAGSKAAPCRLFQLETLAKPSLHGKRCPKGH